jgi:hypothetical protein
MSRISLAEKPRTAKRFVESKIVERPLVRLPDQSEEDDDDDGEEVDRDDEEEDADVEMDEANDDDEEDYEDQESEQIGEDELELERLVFGDSAGFRENLKGFTGDKARRGEVADDSLEDGVTGLEGLDDADVG